MAAREIDHAQVTYDAMAPVYDDFTAGYQAESWTGKLAAKAEDLGLRGRRLLDVGCGTGKSAAPMLARGWEVSGCDISPRMLAVARERLGEAVELEVADVRDLPVFGEFDLVWAVNDTLNYLLDGDEMRAALAGMRANLGAGGVALFDLNTLGTFRASFSATETRERQGRAMTWRGLSSPDAPPGSICEARVEVSGGGADHVHRQRHFPSEEVIELLERAGLGCLQAWGELEGELGQPLDEARHTKAVYLARPAV
jgi:SAM-dependent methyltransferase